MQRKVYYSSAESRQRSMKSNFLPVFYSSKKSGPAPRGVKQALEWVIGPHRVTVPVIHVVLNHICDESRGLLLLVVTEADEMAGGAEGSPGDVEPAVAGQELVGIFTTAEERDQTVELGGVLGADVGSLANKVLRVPDTANEGVDARVAEAAGDDDGTADGLAGGLQQQAAAIDHVGHLLRRRNVGRVLAGVAELCQRKMLG